MTVATFLLLPGLLLLILGARFLVEGASSLASRLGVRPGVIGLTVVAFGTSTPELLVNVSAAVNGASQIAFGNVVGSNIFNTGVILAVAALVAPLSIDRRTTRFEVPLSLLAVLAVAASSLDTVLGDPGPNVIGRSEALLLLGFFLVFVGYTLSLLQEDPPALTLSPASLTTPVALVASLGGLLLLFGGGELTVRGASALAAGLGVSERIIALTIVSVGTSLPELVTSFVAARRGENDLAVSNVVGSNIFNSFFILGTSALISPVTVESGAIIDLAALAILSLLVFLFIFTGPGRRIGRWEAGALLAVYAGYLTLLIAG
ncbi:MAG: calcium/sodium antiporter [Alkalispirochaetaceae bacterium]